MRRFVWGIGLCLMLCGVTFLALRTQPVSAASEGFNVITSPLPIKITTAPGRTITEELRMKNQGSQPEGIKVGLMKFSASGTTGQPDLADLGPKDTYASWVHFSPAEFTAEPNVWKTVKMTINVPPDAHLGYYLAVTFSRASQPGVTGDKTALKGAAATLVLLNVNTGDEQRSLKLVDFSADHSVYEYLPATFSIRIHNSGNIYVAPEGNIFITRGGKTVDTLDFNDAGGSVLPGANRVFNVPWSNGFPVFKERLVNGKPVPDKNDKPKQDLKWNFADASKFRFGHYTAKLLVVYDNGKQDVPMESTLSFWVLPWKLMLAGLLILLLIAFGVWSAFRAFIIRAKGRLGKRGARHEHDKNDK